MYFSSALPHEGSCLLELTGDNSFLGGEGAGASHHVADEQEQIGTVSMVPYATRYLALEPLKTPSCLLNPNCLFGSLWPWKHLTYLHLQQSQWLVVEVRWAKEKSFEFGFWRLLIKTMLANELGESVRGTQPGVPA